MRASTLSSLSLVLFASSLVPGVSLGEEHEHHQSHSSSSTSKSKQRNKKTVTFKSAEEAYSAGLEAVEKGEDEKAVEALEFAINVEKPYPNGFFLLGRAY